MVNEQVKHIVQMIHQARWAPSGDNAQPWRFEILNEQAFIIHIRDTRDWCAFDRDGFGTAIGVGCLLESLALASLDQGYSIHFEYPDSATVEAPFPSSYQIKALLSVTHQERDPLVDYLSHRYVHRYPYRLKNLTPSDREKLTNMVPPQSYRLHLYSSFSDRYQLSVLIARFSYLRYMNQHFFSTFQHVIDWDHPRSSPTKIPAQALGFNPLSLAVIRQLMGNWRVMSFVNRYFAGFLGPMIEVDLLPNLFSSAHFVLLSHLPLNTLAACWECGRVVQRLWLKAASLGINLQPNMMLPIFTRYYHAQLLFNEKERRYLRPLVEQLEGLYGPGDRIGFMGRLGYPWFQGARSHRREVDELMINRADGKGVSSE